MTTVDNPRVIARPPLLYLAALAIALAVHRIRPLSLGMGGARLIPALALIALGLALVVPGRRTLSAAGTHVNPAQPTTVLVTTGPYRFTRNPLYVGITLLFLGLTLAADTAWGLIVLAPLLTIMHLGVVRREERYLERKFGERYSEYRAQVRRYL